MLVRLPEPDEHVRKADDRPGRPALGAHDRLRQAVVGAMSERITIHHKKR
jgi:hypothetical protein